MEESEVDEAEARGESKGDAAAVEGDDTESEVVAVMVRFMAGWPLAETAVEDILKVGDGCWQVPLFVV